MEPPGPAFGRPDDKLSVIRDGLTPHYAALHPGYKAATAQDTGREQRNRAAAC